MAQLVVDVLFKGKVLRSLPFDRETLRIGRMRENDLVIDNLSVSRFHARLHLVDGRVFVEDNGSENGCFVNGDRVRGRLELAPGDTIAVGKHQLRVRSDLGEEPPAAASEPAERSDPWDAMQTYLAGPGTRARMRDAVGATRDPAGEEPAEMRLDAEPDDVLAPVLARDEDLELAGAGFDAGTQVLIDEAEPPSAAAPAGPVLHAGLIVQRDGKLDRIVGWERDSITVGRSGDCDLVLAQDEVSRRHVRFVRVDGRYEVHDLGSVNGTLVDGRRVERHVLEVGDVVTVEGFQLTFVLDRTPIEGAVKTAQPAPAAPRERDTFAMTILQEAMPELGASPAEPLFVAAQPPQFAAAESVLPATDLLVEPVEEADDAAFAERKELAAVRPRGSSRASSVQDLGAAAAAPRVVTLELRLHLDELPEPLRRALEQTEGQLAVPADLRLRLGD